MQVLTSYLLVTILNNNDTSMASISTLGARSIPPTLPPSPYPAGIDMTFNTSETVKSEKTTTEGDGDTFMKLNQYQAEAPSSP